MQSDNEYGSSASRVKAFRTRLSSQFKRVEAYVTEGEKVAIEQVKAELGVTTDVAVAGLLRMGLERFEAERSALQASAGGASASSVQSEALTACASLDVCGALSTPTHSAPALLASVAPSMKAVSVLRSLEVTRSPRAAAPSQPELSALSQRPEDNPIARFFKNRKEISS